MTASRPLRLALSLLLLLSVLTASCSGSPSLILGSNEPEPFTAPPRRPVNLGGTIAGGPVSLTNGSRGATIAEIVPGTGRFVNPAAPVAAPPAAVLSGPDVTLDFNGVDVRDVLKSVLGDLLQVGYVVDPAVQGSVSLQTGRPIPRSSVIDVLNSALQLNGVALVARDGLYQAVPIANAARLAPVGGSSGFVTRVVTPRYVAASDLERALEPLLPPGTTMKADPARNMLTISGAARNVSDLMENVATFDVDYLRGMSFALLPLRNGRARDISVDVNALLTSSGRAIADVVKVLPIERMNAILVTSMQPAYLERVRGWVDRFDRGDGRAEQQLYVYRVQNGRAADLALVLRRALGIESSDTQRGATDTPAAPAPPPIDSAADQLGLTRPGQATSQAASPLATPAAARADPLGAVSQAAAGGNPLIPDVRVTADVANNALIVSASAQDYARIEAAMQKLDIPPLQVLIEATIAEVTLTNALSLGLQYYFRSGEFTNFVAPGVTAIKSLTSPSTVASTFPGFSFASGGNFAFGNANAGVVLNALEKLSTVRVLSSPNLLVLNNRTARLQVGDQVPIATQSSQSTLTSTAQLTNSIEYRDTGVILSVTPRVNASGLVLLDMVEEVSDVSTTTSSTLNSPTISQRRVTSSIAVHDGETIGLGGLIKDNRTKSNSGLPWLKDLPGVGFLFGVQSDEVTRSELIVLITPRVIYGRDDAQAVTNELREKLGLTRPNLSRRGI